MPVARFQFLFQVGADAPAVFFRHEPHRKSHNHRRLRGFRDAARFGEEFPAERRLDFACEGVVICALLFQTERFGGAGGYVGGGVIVRRGDVVRIGSAEGRTLHGVVEREPVGEVEAAHPEALRAAMLVVLLLDPVDPQAHVFKLTAEHRPVAVEQVERPWDERGGVAPGAGAVGALVAAEVAADLIEHVGHDVRHGAVQFALLQQHVVQEFFIERGRVHRQRGGGGEDMRVARPAHALVALRTIGRRVEEVADLAPERVLNQAVHLRVGGFNFARHRKVGMNDAAGEFVQLRFHPLDLYEAEAVERKVRAHMGGLARRNERKLFFGRAEVFTVEAIVLQKLAELQIDLRACGQVAVKFDPAGHHLTEVDHVFARGGAQKPDGLYGIAHAHGRRKPLGQRAGGGGGALCGDKAFERSGRGLQPRVVDFAVVDAAFNDRSGMAQPRVVRAENQLAAVGKFAADLSQQLHAVAVQFAHALHKTKAALVPAVAEHRVKAVLARAQQRRNIIGLILNPVVVIVVERRKRLVGRAPAVYRQLVYAQRRRINAGADGLFAKEERLCKDGMRILAKRRFNPFRRPGFLPLAGFKPRRFAHGRFAQERKHLHAPVIARARRERHFRRKAERGKIGPQAAVIQGRFQFRREADDDAGGFLPVSGRAVDGPGEKRGVHLKAQRVFQMIGAQRTNQHGKSPYSLEFQGRCAMESRRAAPEKQPVRYPFTAPAVNPSIYRREVNRNRRNSGIVATTKPATSVPI